LNGGARLRTASGASAGKAPAHGLQPHRIRRFKLSNDPQFAAKIPDILPASLENGEIAKLLEIG
jgi:hypothetical protein